MADTEIQIHSGTWGAVRAGNNTSDITGTSVVTVDGSAQIDTLPASGNGAVHTANALMNVDGGTIGQIFVTGTDTDSASGNVSITLQAGVVQEDIKACAGGMLPEIWILRLVQGWNWGRILP